MSETTPKSIDALTAVDIETHPNSVKLTENYQGENGGITAQKAGVPYRYFYFDYQMIPKPEKDTREITMSSVLHMDPAQIKGNTWSLIELTMGKTDTYLRLSIEASLPDGTEVTIRSSEVTDHSYTGITLRKGQDSLLCQLTQQDDELLTDPNENVDSQVATTVIQTFNNLMQTAQEMVDRGFANGQPY